MRVLNRHTDSVPRDAVYVGRPSKWGNPFPVEGKRDRPTAIAMYREWIKTQPALMAALSELTGRDLVCSCAPRACHADVLMELANPGYDKLDHIPF